MVMRNTSISNVKPIAVLLASSGVLLIKLTSGGTTPKTKYPSIISVHAQCTNCSTPPLTTPVSCESLCSMLIVLHTMMAPPYLTLHELSYFVNNTLVANSTHSINDDWLGAFFSLCILHGGYQHMPQSSVCWLI